MMARVLVISVFIQRPSGNPDHDTLSDEEYEQTMRARVRDAITTEGEYTPPSNIKSVYITIRTPFTIQQE